MNEQLKALNIDKRIDGMLGILQNIPGLQGFNQWNPVCEVMKRLAEMNNDIQKLIKDNEVDAVKNDDAIEIEIGE